MNKAVLIAMQHMTEPELFFFRKHLVSHVLTTTKDYLKTKKENPGQVLFELHHPKWNIGRRRRGKSSYFSAHA